MTDGPQSRWRAFWDRILAPMGHGRNNAVLLLRLENLGLLTDRLGQAGMTQLFVALSIRLSAGIRDHDQVHILGQGLFAIPLPGRTEAEATRIARRLQARGQRVVLIAGQTARPVLTGVLIRDPGDGPAAFARLIDSGRKRLAALAPDRLGRINLCEPQSGDDTDESLPASVAEAASDGRILAFFQPQVCCDSGRVTGFETLARWDHPTRGLLLPASFMPGMTRTDHSALSRHILRQALAALKFWDRAGLHVPTVSLNISNCELSDPGFAASLLRELERQDIAPGRLVLEVLESVGPVSGSAPVRLNLARLSAAGCLLDLDDFGTGYASLDAIRQFGVHRIKIDRSFVTACDCDPQQQRMILAILALAERLEIATLAEGVETREEHSFLAQIGCNQVQGHVIARPMPLQETLHFLGDYASRAPRLPPLQKKQAG